MFSVWINVFQLLITFPSSRHTTQLGNYFFIWLKRLNTCFPLMKAHTQAADRSRPLVRCLAGFEKDQSSGFECTIKEKVSEWTAESGKSRQSVDNAPSGFYSSWFTGRRGEADECRSLFLSNRGKVCATLSRIHQVLKFPFLSPLESRFSLAREAGCLSSPSCQGSKLKGLLGWNWPQIAPSAPSPHLSCTVLPACSATALSFL